MQGGALEVALALWRQPSQRPALRAQPLPDDVGTLIAIAAGAPDRAARAAAQSGERADDVIDAVRFYLREVMLHADGDAYRLLGAAADAPTARLKAHHRTLQHWLHPDRRGRDDDAVYAARINTAWSLLRTAERRAAYDAAHVASDADAPATRHRVLVTGWRADGPQPRRRRDCALLALAAALCVWLLVLAGRQALAPPPEWEQARESAAFDDNGAAAMSPLAAMAEIAARDAARWHEAAPTAPTAPAAPAAPTAPTASAVVATDGGAPSGDNVLDSAASEERTSASIEWSDGTRAGMRDLDAVEDAAVAASRPLPPPSLAATAVMPFDEADSALRAPTLVPAPTTRPVDTARVRAAQRRGQQLIAFLRGEGVRAPPIWASAAVLDGAEAARGRFGRSDAGGVLRLGHPDWRVASTRATMTAPVHAGDAAAGRLYVELTWRDGTWLVDRLHLDAPPALAQ